MFIVPDRSDFRIGLKLKLNTKLPVDSHINHNYNNNINRTIHDRQIHDYICKEIKEELNHLSNEFLKAVGYELVEPVELGLQLELVGQAAQQLPNNLDKAVELSLWKLDLVGNFGDKILLREIFKKSQIKVDASLAVFKDNFGIQKYRHCIYATVIQGKITVTACYSKQAVCQTKCFVKVLVQPSEHDTRNSSMKTEKGQEKDNIAKKIANVKQKDRKRIGKA